MPRDFLNEQEKTSAPETGRDFLSEYNFNENQPSENLGYSALMAIPRVGEDAYKSAFQGIKNIPHYLDSAKTAIPGAIKTIKENPAHAGGQALAGANEAINSIAQFPKGLASYIENRLKLLPQGSEQFVAKFSPKDTTEAINQLFDKPQNQGEELIRGTYRNIPNILGAKSIASMVNPMRYTNSGIMRKVVGTRNALQNRYGRTYNNIFNHADQNGLGVNLPGLIPHLDLDTAMMNAPAHARMSIDEFIQNPTTRSAHDAKRDLLKIQRKLFDKNERDSLTGGELAQLNAINHAVPNIEANMFTNANGVEHARAARRYRNTQTGYRQEALPYTKNKAINAFRKNELLPHEAVQSLSRGKFAAQRGSHHPEIARRNFINKVAPWVIGGGVGAAGWYGLEKLASLIRDNTPGTNQ
jgi:hypothetical protein